MRVVFCGSGGLAIPTLRAIPSAGHQIVELITQPARKAGRGGKLRATPVARAAGLMGLRALECEDINAPYSLSRLSDARADVMCVADFGQRIGEATAATAGLGAMVLHGSLLPELRGAAPINWAVIRGYEQTGVTSLAPVHEMDAGPIYLQRATEIDAAQTAEELAARLADLGAEVVCETLDKLADGSAYPREQDHALATLAPRLKKTDGLIDWTCEAGAIRNLIHGTWPWPGGQAVFAGCGRAEVPVTIARAAVEAADAGQPPGTVEEDLSVATGSGRLRIIELRPTGRKLMGWRDFVNGSHIQPGDRFVPLTV